MPYATNDGVRIHYEVEGDGTSILLHIHGMGDLRRWRQTEVFDVLRSEYRLILLDPRGQGASDKPHDPEAYALETLVGDIVAVLDDAGASRAHYFGYSSGAMRGFAAGVLAPERFRSLILGGGTPYFDQPQTALMPTVREDVELLQQGMSVFVNQFEERLGPLAHGVREQWLENDGEALAAGMIAKERFPDISAQLATVELPTLIYCGTEDEVYEPARRASQVMPNARFLPLDGLNHPQGFSGSDLILPHIRAFLREVDG